MAGFDSEALRQRLRLPAGVSRAWVACSGGLDSVVLLHALAALRPALPVRELRAVHVDHGLQAASAAWADHCRDLCATLGIPLDVARVSVRPAPGEGVEAAARRARYAVFEGLLDPHACLLTAHHRDDQAETVLLRLLRGSGSHGLAAMPAQRPLGEGLLLRPLLDFDRAALLAYARRHGLRWVEDPTNAWLDADRNFLRHRALPLLTERWPGAAGVLARTAAQLGEDAALLDELAAADLDNVQRDGRPAVAALLQLSEPRRRNLLRYWIRQAGLQPPAAARLANGLQALLTAGDDREPRLAWPQGELRRYRGRLYLLPPLAPVTAEAWQWDLRQPLRLPGIGTLTVEAGQGGLDPRRLIAPVTVRLRRGGERCRPAGQGHSRRLKTWLQEQALPPWERERLPLIYVGDELAAVADRLVCEGFQAAAGMPGLRLRWQPAERSSGSGNSVS